MFKKLFLFIFFILIGLNIKINSGNTALAVKEWHQENTFNEFGQEISIKLLLKAQNLQKGYFHNNWIFKFPAEMDIEFLGGNVLNSDDSNVAYKDKELRFDFKKTFNDGEVFLEFKYQVNNKGTSKYTRQEYISVPPFAVGAQASISVDASLLDDMVLYSNNEDFKYENGKYIWVGNVKREGFLDVFELTKKKARWLLTTTINMTGNSPINTLNTQIPLYYSGGGNSVLNLKISNNQFPYIDYENIKYDDNFIYAKFVDYPHNEAFIEIEGIVENNYDTKKYWLSELDPNKLITVDADTSLILNNIINFIRNNNVNNEPMHIAIAKWVYNNIQYNKELFGEKMTTKEVALRKEGVCQHIAVLYRDMLRTINIPATAVDGVAYDTKNQKFEGHSWVLVYHNGEWIPIDPTWNLYSGKLPISHIFLYKDVDVELSFTKEGEFNDFKVDVVKNVKFIE